MRETGRDRGVAWAFPVHAFVSPPLVGRTVGTGDGLLGQKSLGIPMGLYVRPRKEVTPQHP